MAMSHECIVGALATHVSSGKIFEGVWELVSKICQHVVE